MRSALCFGNSIISARIRSALKEKLKTFLSFFLEKERNKEKIAFIAGGFRRLRATTEGAALWTPAIFCKKSSKTFNCATRRSLKLMTSLQTSVFALKAHAYNRTLALLTFNTYRRLVADGYVLYYRKSQTRSVHLF